jgi:hypothetical protein
MRRRLAALAAVLLAGALAGCEDDTVLVTFRPDVGSTYTYEVEVESTIVRTLEGAQPSARSERALFEARHTVLEAGPGGVRVEVVLRRAGSGSRTFVVRYDRAAQLQAVESVEGIDIEALGDLGLSEIFPAAAGAPPDRRLRPGDRWTIDETVELPGPPGDAELTGSGRLSELGVVDGADVATIITRTELPVATDEGSQALAGSQVTETTARHDLADGSVLDATSITRGDFRVVLSPPDGRTGPPVRGTLSVEVRSTTRRLGGVFFDL